MYNKIKRNKLNIPIFNLNPLYSYRYYRNINKHDNLLKNYIHIFNNDTHNILFNKKTRIRIIDNKYYGFILKLN